MTNDNSKLVDIGSALGASTAAIAYRVSERLLSLYPERHMIEGDACSFDLMEFAGAGRCTIADGSSATYNQLTVAWRGPGKGVSYEPGNVWYAVDWEGESIDVLQLTWPANFSDISHFWIIADSKQIAERFYIAVNELNAVVSGTVLVFDGGAWQKSRELFESIHGATFENLVLAGSLKEELRCDLDRFFSSRATYERYGVPWKRGILLVGPPGNGKTHAVKALINATGAACLYVKSFKSRHGTDHESIRAVFHRARQTTPCILVLEDLDSLINDQNRSFFLNELDGFASNVGIVALATTNHPDRLDSAIVDRPSRFDRKYHFDLPAIAERRAYITLWSDNRLAELRLTTRGIERAAALTTGFSFAYLKELFLTSLMSWINAAGNGDSLAMDDVVRNQIDLLRTQMTSMNRDSEIASDLTPDDPDDVDDEEDA